MSSWDIRRQAIKLNGQTRTFAYNFQDRMTSLTDIDGSVFAYEFDGEGNRLSQSLNDCLSKRFVYDGADVLLELNPTNAVAYAWIDGPGIDQPIERLLFIDGSPRARRVFHSDAIGSIAALTDPAGHVTQTYAYTAFGSLRSHLGPDPNRVTYTAREQLGDSQGWMYYRHRIYAPTLGRFSSSDPLGFVDGANEWSYARSAPDIYTDSSGLKLKKLVKTITSISTAVTVVSLIVHFAVFWEEAEEECEEMKELENSDKDSVELELERREMIRRSMTQGAFSGVSKIAEDSIELLVP